MGGTPEWTTLTRRSLLVAGGSGLLVAGLDVRGLFLPAARADEEPLVLDLVRRDDMLVLRFEFHNLTVSTASTPPALVPEDVRKPSYVVVWFDGQHVMEQTFPDGDPQPPEPDPPGEVHTALVEPSRIAFLVPRTVKSLPFTEEGLFSWWQWTMQVVPSALPAQPRPKPPFPPVPSGPPAPEALVTDLRLVDWVHLSPDRNAAWSHAARPVTHNGRTELWHTRLARRGTDGKAALSGPPATVRAIWADDPDPGTPFNSMVADEVPDGPRQIHLATTTFASPQSEAVTADLLLLSPLGSSVELRGDWQPDTTGTFDLAQWRHRSSFGRDNYVKLVTYGFLFPFGHRAVFVQETQRKIHPGTGAAYLFKREFVIVREPVKDYPGLSQPNGGRRFPFSRVRLTTTQTPVLSTQPAPVVPGSAATWIRQDVPGGDPVDVPFPVVATDLEGRTVEFTVPLAFVRRNEAIGRVDDEDGTPPKLAEILAAFGDFAGIDAPGSRRVVDLRGQQVAFAPSNEPDDTSYPVSRLYLGADGDATPPNGDALLQADAPSFYPVVLAADVRLPAVEALRGPGSTATIGFDPAYVTTEPAAAAAMAADPSDLFARVQDGVANVGNLLDYLAGNPPPGFTDTPVGATFSDAADKVGGVAVPNLSIGALSKTFGPLSGSPDGLSDLQNGTFDPADFFPEDLGAKLLGAFSLADLLSSTNGSGPRIVTTTVYPDGDTTQPPEAVLTTFDWAPPLNGVADLPSSPFQPVGPDDRPASLVLHGEFRTQLDSGQTTTLLTGDLRDFTLVLVSPDLELIKLTFNRFAFEQRDTAKPQFDVDLERVDFVGALEFVNTLKDFLSSFGAGPSLDLQPSGITAGFTLPIPTVAIGVFSLQNMTFSAELTLPFDNTPVSATFGFCSRENPFVVSVLIFGGGGYFALELDTGGLRSLEAAIEFGGVLALDIVVASGSLSVMAGLYFKYENDPETNEKTITLRGYVRAVGRLSVLGLITITAEFYLALEYRNEGGESFVEGEASLKVSIDILFFSATVTVSVRKRFAGSSGGAAALARAAAAAESDTPQFADLVTQQDWNAYCASFAA